MVDYKEMDKQLLEDCERKNPPPSLLDLGKGAAIGAAIFTAADAATGIGAVTTPVAAVVGAVAGGGAMYLNHGRSEDYCIADGVKKLVKEAPKGP